MRSGRKWWWITLIVGVIPVLFVSVLACPPGALSSTVSFAGSSDLGSVQIESCVSRDGDIDTYTYIVTNIDYEYSGCGVIQFGIDNWLDLETIAFGIPAGWIDNSSAAGWGWYAGTDVCGIEMGETAEFSFSVRAPTTGGEVLGSLPIGDSPTTFEALGPVASLAPPPEPSGTCPGDALGSDISTGYSFGVGRANVEACVTRTGTVDTYTYTVTNESFDNDGCGVTGFAVVNVAELETLAFSMPIGWTDMTNATNWAWQAPSGDCGILVGESAVFWFSVLAPTEIGPASSGVTGSGLAPGEGLRQIHIDTIAPVEAPSSAMAPPVDAPARIDLYALFGAPADCADLVIAYFMANCDCGWNLAQEYECTLEVSVTVRNNGGLRAYSFPTTLTADKEEDFWILSGLDPGESRTFRMSIPGCVDCRIPYTITIDPYNVIPECNEENNEESGKERCTD